MCGAGKKVEGECQHVCLSLSKGIGFVLMLIQKISLSLALSVSLSYT